MKRSPILITALLVFGLAPFASADGECAQQSVPKSEETLRHPTEPTRYFLVDLTTPEKTGEWTELNGWAGLQTDDCKLGALRIYKKDAQNVLLP